MKLAFIWWFTDGIFSPLADGSGSRGEMPSSRSGSRNAAFSPSVYYTAVAANPSLVGTFVFIYSCNVLKFA
jgi:hypothetical protein